LIGGALARFFIIFARAAKPAAKSLDKLVSQLPKSFVR